MGGWRCHSPREGSERRGNGVFWTSRERQDVPAQRDRTVRSCMAPWCGLSLIPQMFIEDLLCPGHSCDTSLESPSEKVTDIQSISRQPKAAATERIALASAEALHLGADALDKKGRQILITLIPAMPPESWLKPGQELGGCHFCCPTQQKPCSSHPQDLQLDLCLSKS